MAQDQRRLPPHLRGRFTNPNPIEQPIQNQVPEQPQPPINQYKPIEQQKPIQQQPSLPQPKLIEAPKKPPQKIDTDLIPRPIIKSEESINPYNFSTAPVPLYHPPMSHQYFTTTDEGNSGPRYMRCSTYAIGNEPSIFAQTELPFGIVVQPLAEEDVEIPQVQFPNEPIRCTRCKAYVNSYFQFIEQGNAYICNICKMKNSVPLDYYSPLGQGNQRGDKFERAELSKGSYEILAPDNYIKKKIENILILFCIELTQISVKKGVYAQIIQSMQTIIDTIPNAERTDIAFITFDNKIQFYNIPQNLSGEPQIIVVSDLDEANVPLPQEKLFLNVVNDRDKIDYMLEKLQKFGDTYIVNNKNQLISCGTVLSNAYQMMQPHSGRILYFGCSPSLCGIGKLQLKRIDQKSFGTDNEKLFYQPQDQTYIKLGQQCLRSHISVDLFVFNDESFELATIVPITNLTGGSIYFYQNYNPIINGTELHYALYRNLTRSYAYDCIMTVRSSSGIILIDYYTSSGKISVKDLELSTIDADKSIGVILKQEEKIIEPEAYIQYALLYTNSNGQRVIRVFNQQLQVVNKSNGNNAWHNIFKTADIDAVNTLLIRRTLSNLLISNVKTLRQTLFDNLVNILHAYRKYCSSTSSAVQLILPEAIKILPLYIQSLYKRDILKTGIVRIDNRIYEFHLLMSQSFNYLCNFLYPKLYALGDMQSTIINEKYYLGQTTEQQYTVMPTNISSTQEKIVNDGLYLLDTSQYIYIYVPQGIQQAFLKDIFDVKQFNELSNIEQLPNLETDLSVGVANIIEQLQKFRGGAYIPTKIIRQNSTTTQQFTSKLFEDDQQLEKSYADFLCELHGSISAKGI